MNIATKLLRHFAVDTIGDEPLPRPRWIQWGTRGVDAPGAPYGAYRYFFLRLPAAWPRKDFYYGAYVKADGTFDARRVWHRPCLLWIERTKGYVLGGWRLMWEAA